MPKTSIRIAFLFLILFSTSCGIFKKKQPSVGKDSVEQPIITSKIPAESQKGYQNGMVVAAHPIASTVGVQILKKGGNAIDAAVAVQFALAVVYPNAGNLGGGGFLVYRSSTGEKAALDFRETAPSEGTKDMYLDMYANPIADLSLRGQLASGVPGSVDGMEKAHKKYGKLAWNDLIQPAVILARNGFSITAMQARALNSRLEQF